MAKSTEPPTSMAGSEPGELPDEPVSVVGDEIGAGNDQMAAAMDEQGVADSSLSDTMRSRSNPGRSTTPALRDSESPADTSGASSSAAAAGAGTAGTAGLASWVPWAALVVVGGIAGGVLGVSGALGRPVTVAPPVTAGVVQTTEGYDCPGGTAVASFTPNQRVFVRERSEDGSWVSVRDPLNGLRTVWVPIGVITVDDGQAPPESLVVGGCPEPVVVLTALEQAPVEPAPQQPGPPAPPPPPPPPPVGDTTAPTISSATWSKPSIGLSDPTTLTVAANDDTAVTGVAISWSGAQSGSAQMSASGSQWLYTFTATPTASGTITFRVQARDAAGNLSAPVLVPLSYIYFG